MTGPVERARMIGIGPGFSGGTNGAVLSVLYTASETMSQRRPRAPLPRWLMTEAVLVLRRSFRVFKVSNDG
jgi:hypothetical protein